MNKTELARIVEKNMKEGKAASEIANDIADALNKEWYFSRKDTCEDVIT